MTSAFSVLLRVKTLRQEEALRVASEKRRKAEVAREDTERANERVRMSTATLESRQDQVYAKILGRIVKLNKIEETKSEIVKIEKDHGKLLDTELRAEHVQAEAESERDAAIDRHRKSLTVVEKYNFLTSTEEAERRALEEDNEEKELEDLSGIRRRSIG